MAKTIDIKEDLISHTIRGQQGDKREKVKNIDEFFLPFPMIILQFRLSDNSLSYIRKTLEVNQPVAMIFSSKSRC